MEKQADNGLILTSDAPGKVTDDPSGNHGVLMNRFLSNLNSRSGIAEAAFNKTCAAVSRASGGAQVPSVSSSLPRSFRLEAGSSADDVAG
jgi:hypothetical protein